MNRGRGGGDHGVWAVAVDGDGARGLLDDPVDGALTAVQRELRVQRQRDDHRDERHDHERVGPRHLARRHLRPGAVVHRADEHPQRVDRRQRDAGERDDREHDLGLEDAEQDQELADEVRRAGHRQQRERHDQKQRRQHRRAHRDPAEVAQVLRALGARGQQCDDQERRNDDEPVVQRLEQRALVARRLQREDPEHDEAELGDRRVAEHEPHVGRRERERRPVEDRRQRDQQHQRLEVRRPGREQRQRDPQEAVGRDLAQHAAEHGQHRQRHRAVAVGHPAVERELRHLDQERGREEQEDPLLRAGRQVALDRHEAEVDRVAGRALHEHPGGDRRGEHQQRADERVDDELRHPRHRLGRRRPVGLPRAAPHPGEEEERDQHQVEERREQDQVLRAQRPEHRRLGEREEQVERALAAPRRPCAPRVGRREHQRRQRDQEHAEPVDADRVVHAERRDPVLVGRVVRHGARGGRHLDEQEDRDPERPQRRDQRREPGRAPRDQDPEHGAGQREPDEDREVHQLWSRK